MKPVVAPPNSKVDVEAFRRTELADLKFYPPREEELNAMAVACGFGPNSGASVAPLCGRFLFSSQHAIFELVLPPLTPQLLESGEPIPLLRKQTGRSSGGGDSKSSPAAAASAAPPPGGASIDRDVKSNPASGTGTGGNSGGSSTSGGGRCLHRMTKRMDFGRMRTPLPVHPDLPECLLTRSGSSSYLSPHAHDWWFNVDYTRWCFTTPPRPNTLGRRYPIHCVLSYTPYTEAISLSPAQIASQLRPTPHKTKSGTSTAASAWLDAESNRQAANRSLPAVSILYPSDTLSIPSLPPPVSPATCKPPEQASTKWNYQYLARQSVVRSYPSADETHRFPLPTDRFVESVGLVTVISGLLSTASDHPGGSDYTRRFDRAQMVVNRSGGTAISQTPSQFSSLPMRLGCEIPVWAGDNFGPNSPASLPLPPPPPPAPVASAGGSRTSRATHTPAAKLTLSTPTTATSSHTARDAATQRSLALTQYTPLPHVLIALVLEYALDSIPAVYWISHRLNDPNGLWPVLPLSVHGHRHNMGMFNVRDWGGPLVLCTPDAAFRDSLRSSQYPPLPPPVPLVRPPPTLVQSAASLVSAGASALVSSFWGSPPPPPSTTTSGSGGSGGSGDLTSPKSRSHTGVNRYREPAFVPLQPHLTLPATFRILQASPDGLWIAGYDRDLRRWSLFYGGATPFDPPVTTAAVNARRYEFPSGLESVSYELCVPAHERLRHVPWTQSTAQAWFAHDSKTFYVIWMSQTAAKNEVKICRLSLDALLTATDKLPTPKSRAERRPSHVPSHHTVPAVMIPRELFTMSDTLSSSQIAHLNELRGRTMNVACDGLQTSNFYHTGTYAHDMRSKSWYRYRQVPTIPVWKPPAFRFMSGSESGTGGVGALVYDTALEWKWFREITGLDADGSGDEPYRLHLVCMRVPTRTQILLSLRHHNRSADATSGFGSAEYESFVERKRAALTLWCTELHLTAESRSEAADQVRSSDAIMSKLRTQIRGILYPPAKPDVKAAAAAPNSILSVDDRQLLFDPESGGFMIYSLAHGRTWPVAADCGELMSRIRRHFTHCPIRCWYVRPLSETKLSSS